MKNRLGLKALVLVGAMNVAAVLLASPAHPLKGPKMKDIKLGGHVGEAFDRHIANGLVKKDADVYAAVFDKRKLGKKGNWAADFWGMWAATAIPAQEYSGNTELKAHGEPRASSAFRAERSRAGLERRRKAGLENP